MAGIRATKSHKDVTVEQMDYGYIDKCSNEKELGYILQALKSGREGFYPDLIEHCEKKLQSLNPQNKALRKQQPILKARDLKMEEQQNLNDDMENWMDEMNSHDTTSSEKKPQVNGFGDHSNLPPVRGSHFLKGNKKEKVNGGDRKEGNPNRIKSSDYKAWDKFNVEKECEKIDSEVEKDPPVRKTIALSDEIDASGLTEAERAIKAVREKEKGNEAFKSGDFEEALSYYCRSISLQPIPATYNNRALVYLRLERWQGAVNDCNTVLSFAGEGENLKAILRRATAFKALGSYSEAKADLIFVLGKEPNNARAKNILAEVEKLEPAKQKKKEDDSQDNKDESIRAKQGKRMVIQEVDCDSEGEEEDSLPPVATASEHVQSSFTTSGGQPIFEEADIPSESSKMKIQTSKAENPVKDFSAEESPSMNVAEYTDDSVIKTNEKAENPSDNENPLPQEKVIPPPVEPKFPSATEKLKTKAGDLFRSGSYDDACEHYTKAIESLSAFLETKKVDKGHELACAVLHNNRAACWLKQGSDRACVDDCTKVLEIKIWDTKALMRRAVAYEHMEKYSLAWADFQSAYNMDRNNDLAQNGANRVAKHLREIHGLQWREKVPKVQQYPHHNSHTWVNTQPINQPTEPQKEVPSSTPVPVRNVPFDTEKSILKEKAEKQPLSEEIKEMPNSRASLPVVNQADKKGKPKGNGRKADNGATKKAKSSRKRSKPKSKSSRKNSEKTKESEKELADKEEKRIKIRRDLFEKLKTDGNDFVKKGKYDSAIECYTRCSNLCPMEPVSYTNRALCLLKLRKHISAINDCTEAIKLDPVNVKAYYRRALASKAQGFYKDAERDMKKLLEIDPSNKAAKVELEALKKSAWDAARSTQNTKTQTKKVPPRKKQLIIEEVDSSSSSDEGEFVLPKDEPEKTKEETTSKSDPKDEDDSVNVNTSDGPVETSSIKSGKSDIPQTKKSPTLESMNNAVESTNENTTNKSEDDAINVNTSEGPVEIFSIKSGKIDITQTKSPTSESINDTAASTSENTTNKSEDDAINVNTSDDPVEISSLKSGKIDIPQTKSPTLESVTDAAEESTCENTTKKSEDLDNLVAKEGLRRPTPAIRPLTPYEFGNAWNSVTDRKNVTAYKALLDQVAPKHLPTLISNKIDDHVIKVVAIVALECIQSSGDYQRAYDMMLHLTKAKRFSLAALFLTEVDQKPLVAIFEALSEYADRTFSKKDLTNLENLYCMP